MEGRGEADGDHGRGADVALFTVRRVGRGARGVLRRLPDSAHRLPASLPGRPAGGHPFSLAAAGATFAFLLTTGNGQLRAFFLIGELVGFSLYHCTLGALLIGAAKGIIAAIRWLFGLIYRVFVAPVLRLLEKIRGFLAKIMKQSAKCIKNKAKNSRIPLKKHSHLLYNLKKRLQWDGQKKNVKEQEQPGS